MLRSCQLCMLQPLDEIPLSWNDFSHSLSYSFILKSTLFNVNMVTPAFFSVFAWCSEICFSFFNLWSLKLFYTTCWRVLLFIQLTICLLIGVFRLFTFIVITDIVDFKSAVLLLVFTYSIFYFLSSFPALFRILWLYVCVCFCRFSLLVY